MTDETTTVDVTASAKVAPSTDEALARLQMPLEDAMQTQRAIRRLTSEPVDDAVLLRCIELAQKAPTGSNSQTWEFVIVRDRGTKAEIAKLNRTAWGLYGRMMRKQTADDDKMQRLLNAVEWQVDNFEDLPVIVVPCLRTSLTMTPMAFSTLANASFYGSIFPSVQNFLLACRAVGLGACLTTLPLWNMIKLRKVLGMPWNVRPVAVIPVGWPKGRYGPTTRRPVGEIVHVDRFGNTPFA